MKKAELPHNRPFPSPLEIKLKMAEGYGSAQGGVMDSLFSHCAIVAENIFYSSLFPKKPLKRTFTIHLKRTAKRGESYRTTGYTCPHCFGDVHIKFCFCPSCGAGLEWVKTKNVARMKMENKLQKSA